MTLDELRTFVKVKIGGTVKVYFKVCNSEHWEVDFFTNEGPLPSPNDLLVQDILTLPQKEDEPLYVSFRRTWEQPTTGNFEQAEQAAGLTDYFHSGIHWSKPWGCEGSTQSREGQSELLSSLMVLTKSSSRDVAGMVGFLRRLTNFPPAAHCLHLALSKKYFGPAEAAVVSNSIYYVLRKLFPDDEAQNEVIQHARALFSMLKKDAENDDYENEDWVTEQLTCAVTHERIEKVGYFADRPKEFVDYDLAKAKGIDDRGALVYDVQKSRMIRDRTTANGPHLEIHPTPKVMNSTPDWGHLQSCVSSYDLSASLHDKMLKPVNPAAILSQTLKKKLTNKNFWYSEMRETYP